MGFSFSIDVQVRRVGGAFGVKISRNIQSAIACGLVVQKLNRPCRFIQSLSASMRAIGKKLPCTTDFEVSKFLENNQINKTLHIDSILKELVTLF